MINEKGLGGKRICRVNLSLTNKTNAKLNKLAVSCGAKPTTLAAMLVEMCLDNPTIVSQLQKKHNIYEAYKVMPINKNGEIEYMLRG